MKFLKDEPPVITKTLNLKILSYFCDVFDSKIVKDALNSFWDKNQIKLGLEPEDIAEKYKYGKNSIQVVVNNVIKGASKYVSLGFDDVMDDIAKEEGIGAGRVEKFDKVKFDKSKPKKLDYVLRIRYDYCSDTFLMIWIFTYDETDPFELYYKVKVDREGEVVYVENVNDDYLDTSIAVYKGVKSYSKHWEIYGTEDYDEMWG